MHSSTDSESVVKDLELKSLIGFDGNPFNGLIVHPDGVHLVYPLGTNVITYNWLTKKQRFFEGHINVISAVSLSATGKYVGAGQTNFMGFRSSIIVWQFKTGQAVAKYTAHKVRVESVAFTCCERYCLSLGGMDDDGIVMVYDVENKELVSVSSTVKRNGGESTVIKPMYTRDKCFIVAGDNVLKLFTLSEDRKMVWGLDVPFARIKRKILCVGLDHLDEYAYCGTSTGDILIIKLNFSSDDTASPVLVGCFAKHPAKKNRLATMDVELYNMGVTSLRVMPEGTIIVGTGYGVVELVRKKPRIHCKYYQEERKLATPTHPLLVTLKSADVESSVTSIQVMDSEIILVGTIDCELFTIRATDFHVTRMFTCHTSTIFDLAFPHDYSKVFATASKNDVRVWSVDTLQELLRITVKAYTCTGVLFTYDGSQIVTSWNDGNIRTFLPESGCLLYVIYNCNRNGVSAFAISKDGNMVLSGGGDGQVRVWLVENLNGVLKSVLKEHKGPISSIDIHHLGLEAVTASTDGTCIVWDIIRFIRLSSFSSTTVFTCVKYHPDGNQIITCGTNSMIGFWEAVDGSLVREIQGFSASSINSLDITSTGKYIVTGSSDRMVKVWIYHEGIPTHVGVGHAGVVTNVKVSPDSRFVVSTSVDGGIFLWRFPYDTDILPSSRRSDKHSHCSLSEQQTNRSRQLSLKKSMPARKENINGISRNGHPVNVRRRVLR